MNDYLSENERIASEYLGSSYVKVPRLTLMMLRSGEPSGRLLWQLHLTLFGACFFVDGVAKLNGRKVPCKRGEWVGTQKELAEMAAINIGSINRLIRQLEAMHLISVSKIQGGSLIRVNGYISLHAEPAKREKEKKLSLSEQLKEAKRQLGGRQMPE